MRKIEKALEKLDNPLDFLGGESQAKAKPKGKPGKSRRVKLNEEHMHANRVVTAQDRRYMDYYNLLRTQLLHRTRSQGLNSIMITSAMPHEGATLTAINLAMSIAKDLNQFCLLVDTHLREPIINEYLGFKSDKGLIDYLMKDEPIFDLIINPDIDKLTILPAGKPVVGSTEILGSPRMSNLVSEMKERYPDRYVLFNCPPLLTVPDALVFSTYVDATILVVEAGKTSVTHINKALGLLKDTNVLGLVLNKAREDIVS